DPDEMGDALPFVNLGTDEGGEPLGVVDVSARNSSTCAILEGGAVKCWGYGGPSLGLGAGGGNRGDAPEELGDNLPFVETGDGLEAILLSPGPCALFTNDRMKCWGYNDHGQLGLGDTENRGGADGEMGDALPVLDLGSDGSGAPLGVSAITSGAKHTCAALIDGRVKCWGQNDDNGGQLGLGDTDDRGDAPGEMGDALPVVGLGQ
ncbi:MAG: hypothetical protein VX938_13315, partial [Myxococcota bacterium]|nr:hypothetical protein [Myxococcota bacterium]